MSIGAALVSGGLSALGSIFTNEQNVNAQREATQANMRDAAANRSFQAEMSNTAHQREMDDLKKAGLNPILTGTGGAGSSTPSGSTGNAVAPTHENFIGKGIASAFEAKTLMNATEKQGEEINNMRASRRLTDAQTVNTAADTAIKTSGGKAEADLKKNIFGPVSELVKKATESAKASAKEKSSDREEYLDRRMREAIKNQQEYERRHEIKRRRKANEFTGKQNMDWSVSP